MGNWATQVQQRVQGFASNIRNGYHDNNGNANARTTTPDRLTLS